MQTKKDITSHPLSAQLLSCDSPNAIITVLRFQVRKFDQSQSADEKWTKLLDPAVNVLSAFNGFLNVAGPVNREPLAHPKPNPLTCETSDIPTCGCDFYWNWYPPSSEHLPRPTRGCFGDIYPFQVIKDVRDSEDALIELFGLLEFFFKRLEAYIKVRPTAAMTDIIFKIMVEVISILGIVTKEIGQGRFSMSFPFEVSPRLTFTQRKISRRCLEYAMSQTRFNGSTS